MESRAAQRMVLRAGLLVLLDAAIAVGCAGFSPASPDRAQQNEEYTDRLIAELGPLDAEPASGSILVGEPVPTNLSADVILAIDVSGSTGVASGIDVDRDGELGFDPHAKVIPQSKYPDAVMSTDPGDTILAAEVQAARSLLASLGGRDVRVAVVSFSGAVDPVTGTQKGLRTRNARLAAPLSADPASASAAIDEIARAGSSGATDFSAGIGTAGRALCNIPPRVGASRVVLFVTDGVPSLPYGRGDFTDPGDIEAAIAAARKVGSCGARVDVFAVGPQALGNPVAARAVAKNSGGSYYPIRQAADLESSLRLALVAK